MNKRDVQFVSLPDSVERTSWLITYTICLIIDIKVYHFIVYNLAILGNIWYVTD